MKTTSLPFDTLPLTTKQVEELRNDLDGKTLEELNNEFDSLNNEYSSREYKLPDDAAKAMSTFIENFPNFNAKAESAGFACVIHEKLSELHGLTVNEIKMLQKLIMGASWTNLHEATELFDRMKDLQGINTTLLNYDIKFRQYSEFISRKQAEKDTGLKHKDGDQEAAHLAATAQQ